MINVNAPADSMITKLDIFSGAMETHSRKEWIFRSVKDYKDFCRLSDCVQMSGNDILFERESPFGDRYYLKRPYLFYDEDGRIVDPRSWEPEIQEIMQSEEKCRLVDAYFREQRRKRRASPPCPEYRREPVPLISFRDYRDFFRSPHIANALRSGSDPEYMDMIRTCRQAHTLRLEIEERVRSRSRSWKDCTRCEHQWETKMRRRKKREAVWVEKKKRPKTPAMGKKRNKMRYERPSPFPDYNEYENMYKYEGLFDDETELLSAS